MFNLIEIKTLPDSAPPFPPLPPVPAAPAVGPRAHPPLPSRTLDRFNTLKIKRG